MSEKPILFKGDMVRAILGGTKTQTRRVIKPQPPEDVGRIYGPELYEPARYDKNGDMYPGKPIFGIYDEDGEWGAKYPYCIGDNLWVRETWSNDNGKIKYRADGPSLENGYEIGFLSTTWRPSIFMPRSASRITLEITDVRVQRVQDISEDDAFAEGIGEGDWLGDPVGEYKILWNIINAKRGYSWESNPWVYAVTFKVLEKPR